MIEPLAYLDLLDLTDDELISLKFRLERNLKLCELALKEHEKYAR